MAATERHLAPPCVLLLLSSLLLLSALDGEARAAEEGVGLPPSSPTDNGERTEPNAAPTAGKRNEATRRPTRGWTRSFTMIVFSVIPNKATNPR